MDSHAIMIPGGLRLRSLHPLDQSGSCNVIYDLERNVLVEVPDVYRYYIAMALESGNPDENLLGWLASEDLLTYERGASTSREGGTPMTDFSELSHPFGCVYFVDDHAHCQLGDGTDQGALETLDCLLHRLDSLSHLTLHLDATGEGLSLQQLQRIVGSTAGRVKAAGRSVTYDLRLDPAAATPDLVDLLEHHDFRVRARCSGPAEATPAVRAGLERLSGSLGDGLVVHAFLRGDRLEDLWAWARGLGLRRLHATKLAPARDDLSRRERELRQFREDLALVTDQMIEGLQSGRGGTLYEPLVRVVRRMARQHGTLARGGASLGWVSNGRMLPVYHGGSAALEAGPELGAWGLDEELDGAEDVDPTSPARAQPCAGCWAQRLCGRGLAADPALSREERLQPGADSCEVWRTEVEAGLLFYYRLRELDSDHLLGLAENDQDGFVDPLDDAGGYIEWKTC